MKAHYQNFQTHWLRTNHPVSSMNSSLWKHLPAVEYALQAGVSATRDKQRPEFYEIEIGNHWYYIHIPSRISGVYLIGAGEMNRDERAFRHEESEYQMTEVR